MFSALQLGESAEAPSAALLCRSLQKDHAPRKSRRSPIGESKSSRMILDLNKERLDKFELEYVYALSQPC